MDLDPNLEVITIDDHRLLCRTSQGILELAGANAEALRNQLESEMEPVDSLNQRHRLSDSRPSSEAFIENADRKAILDRTTSYLRGDSNRSDARRILVLGNGRLALTIAQRLRDVAGVECEFVLVQSLKMDQAYSDRVRTQVLYRPSRNLEVIDATKQGVRVVESLNIADLQNLVVGFSLIVYAFEDTPYRAAFDINKIGVRLGIPILFVCPEPFGMVVGPLVLGGVTPCFECAQRSSLKESSPEAIESVDLFTGGTASSLQLNDTANVCEILVESLPNELKGVLYHSLIVQPGKRSIRLIDRRVECGSCGSESAFATKSVWPELYESALVHHPGLSSAYRDEKEPFESEYKSVCIVGGGTAGYLTALALQKAVPDLEVSLVESSEIPIIGVGEATTPELIRFLHSYLEFDMTEFFAHVRPTWKLGIRFEWGIPGDYYFNYPFGEYGHPLESYMYDSNIRNYCLLSMLMSSGKLPVFSVGDSIVSSLHEQRFQFAYHLENKRFVSYLVKNARQRGVKIIDATIVDIELTENGDKVNALVTKDGRRLSSELFIDCTGFHSALLEKAMGSRFISWDQSLFTDTAVVASVPHGGRIKPYTVAETMENGWCWNTPLIEEDHKGYVFSSAFCSPDEAVEEMRRKNPEMGEHRLVKFRSGRHEDFWKGNVVALGNSYGFVEPLESTAIHMVVEGVRVLIDHFPVHKGDTYNQGQANKIINDAWDHLRWFLAIHFKFNNRCGSSFWEACRHKVDINGGEDVVGVFREGAPLFFRSHIMQSHSIWGDIGYDILLFGQKLEARLLRPRVSKPEWRQHITRNHRIVQRAIPHEDALQLFIQDPSLLRQIILRSNSWLRAPHGSPRPVS